MNLSFNRKKIGVAAILLILVSTWLTFSVERHFVDQGQTGVLVLPGKIVTYQPGEQVWVWPLVSRLIILSQKTVLYAMTGEEAIKITSADRKLSVNCQVRYQLGDPALLIEKLGADDPQGEINRLLREEITRLLSAQIAKDHNFPEDTMPRIIFVAESTIRLNELLGPQGVSVLSFDLLSW